MKHHTVPVVTLVCFLLTPHFSSVSAAARPGNPSPPRSECKLAIDKPGLGDRVGPAASSEGFAEIPVDGYLWIFAHLQDFDGYWPQGNGPARIVDQRWGVRIFYGKPVDIGSRFEVIAMVVDRHQNEELKKWVAEAVEAGYPPTALPDPMQGCPVARVIVEKIR